jgi:trimethylguanosine synthase
MFSNPKRDAFWAKRYLLFDKFDLGIKLDEESWYTAVPEAVAEHISVRIKCATVLDGYCGVGCNAIKFANTCHTVLANDKDSMKIECLEANECVYGV